MKTKTILILGKLPPPYMGPAIATQILLNSCLKNRFCLLHIDTRANDSLTTMGKWSLKKLFRNFSIYIRYLKICIKQKPDLVLIPISQSTLGFVKDAWFIWMAALTGRKSLIQLRGSDFKNWYAKVHPAVQFFVRITLSKTKGVIVLGTKLKSLFTGFYPDEKIYVAPNGGNYVFPERKNNGNTVQILYLGNLQASKGIEDVVESTRLLLKMTTVPFKLTALGGWRNDLLKQRLLSEIEKEQLPVQFIPPERSSEKFQLLSDADIFVFTPREPEGHPWVIVEAMAAGLPIISTDKGAITESVIHNVNGFIVPERNPQAIAEHLLMLVSDPERRRKMGERSRHLYRDQFTEEKMTDRYSEIFNRLTSG